MKRIRISLIILLGCTASVAYAADQTPLAEQYPRDKGIGKDPAVIFHEDFEDDRLKERGWYDLAGWGKSLTVSDDDQATGRRSLKLFYPKGKTGPWCRAPHFDKGYDTVYVRYYRKWSDDWDWGGPGDGNGHDTRLVSGGPDTPRRAYKNHDKNVLMMESCTHFDPWKRGLFGLMLHNKPSVFNDTLKQSYKRKEQDGHKLRGREWWLATTDQSRSPKSEPGQWYCVEYMASMNTPGREDGEIKAWIDGKLYYHIKDVLIRDESMPDLQWRRWWIGPYFHGGTTKDQSSYIDSIVIATKYIGPIAEGEE